ncbi:hypothetical protein ACFWDI_38540 [Streptomyces sp. NPDC060064]|uniref:hypothetical protein n=1 Tax=Streptomyces sp. NPDC060064 TaxID=3347049 RepID=UPI003675D8C1
MSASRITARISAGSRTWYPAPPVALAIRSTPGGRHPGVALRGDSRFPAAAARTSIVAMAMAMAMAMATVRRRTRGPDLPASVGSSSGKL